MKLLVLFTCVEQRIPPRCRKPRRVSRDSSVELDIREVTAEQAPVAIRVGPEDSSLGFEYRWFDGRLWTSVNVSSVRPPPLAAGGKIWDCMPVPSRLDLRGDSAWSHEHLHRMDATRRDHEAMVASFTVWAADTLIVDGVTYRPAGEPRYVVVTFGLSNNHGGTSVMLTDHYNENLRADRYFGLSERGRAVKVGDEVARDRGDTKSLPMRVLGPEIEVLMPDVLQVWNPATCDDSVPARQPA